MMKMAACTRECGTFWFGNLLFMEFIRITCPVNMPVTKRPEEPESKIKRGYFNIWSTSVALILVAALTLDVCLSSPRKSYVLCSKTKNIYTVDQNNPRAECISVRDSRIVRVGNFGTSGKISYTFLCFLFYTRISR